MGAVKIPCWFSRARPIGPPAPRLCGRRPRRRLCFPPPEEECPGPAFIFFLLLSFRSKIPEVKSRPGFQARLFRLPLRPARQKMWRKRSALPLHCTSATGRPNPTSAGCYLRTMPKLSMLKLDSNSAPGVVLGANGQPGSMAIGNTLMLLMKPPTTQVGNSL